MASGMNEENVNKEQLEERYNPRPLILVAVFLAILGFFFFISHRYFSLAKPIDGSVWGEFGDFVGGVIGTIIAYISIRLLVATLNTQALGNIIAKETADRSLYETKLQRLNANFQMMLEQYRKTLDKFNANDRNQNAPKGLDYLKKRMAGIYNRYNCNDENYRVRNADAIKAFNGFYIANRAVASVYFRIIYRLLELIFTSPIESEDQAVFAKMLRCQLSEEELFFIRYNAMTPNGANMRKYLNQFNMMKHLPELSILEFKCRDKQGLQPKDKSQMISSLIGLRKDLIKRDKYAPNHPITPLLSNYDMNSVMSEDRHRFEFIIARPSVNLPADLNQNESFNKLTFEELKSFMCDFITELFTCYNFCEYQSATDIDLNDESIAENGVDTIKITVSPREPQKKLYLYIDLFSKPTEGYDS